MKHMIKLMNNECLEAVVNLDRTINSAIDEDFEVETPNQFFLGKDKLLQYLTLKGQYKGAVVLEVSDDQKVLRVVGAFVYKYNDPSGYQVVWQVCEPDILTLIVGWMNEKTIRDDRRHLSIMLPDTNVGLGFLARLQRIGYKMKPVREYFGLGDAWEMSIENKKASPYESTKSLSSNRDSV